MITRAVIRNVNVARARAWRRLFREIREVSMSELPREVAREGRGLGASEGSQIRYVVVYVVVSGLPRNLRFVVVASVESPRLAVVTRASRLAGRARRPDGGRAPLPLLPWDGKDRVEGASRTRISRWVVDLDLFSKRRQSRRSTRATLALTEAYVGRRRGRAPADAARNARIQRRRVAPVPPAGGAGDSSDDDLEDVVESERPVQFAIKCGWRSLVGLQGEKRTRFLDLVDRTVDYVSWMRVRASHIATLYYLDVCERVELDQSDERHLPLDDLPRSGMRGVEVGGGGRSCTTSMKDFGPSTSFPRRTGIGSARRNSGVRRRSCSSSSRSTSTRRSTPPSPRSRSTCRTYLTQRQSGSPPSFACICE